MHALQVPARFCGPPGNANGGYLGGCLAPFARATGPVEITFLAPCPLDQPLRIVERDGAVFAEGPQGPVARARPATLDIDVPAPPGAEAVAAVAGRSRALETHPFPQCFVCGPERRDGLGLLPGPVDERAAALWTPAAEWGDDSGEVRAELLWAALDCPSSFPLLEDGEVAARLEPMVLGRMTAQVLRPLAVGHTARIVAWRLALEGRKGSSATAIFDADAELIALARCSWVSIQGR